MKYASRLGCGLLILLLGSCTWKQPPAPPVTAQSPTDDSAQPIRSKSGGDPAQNVHQQLHALLDRSDYLGTLRLLSKEASKRNVSQYFEEYDLALRVGMREGQRLIKEEKFREGGILYRQMLNHYPSNLSVPCSISEEQLNRQLNLCSDRIMTKGLAEYRAGQLAQAVVIWETILSFDPTRIEAKKAINTTTLQLHNLNSKP